MEKLSSDILEENFIRVFQPIHRLQYLTGFQRVKIEHRFVTAPTVYYQFYSCVLWLFNILTSVYAFVNCEINLEGLSNVYAFKLGCLIEVTINAVNAYRNNFTNRHLNSQLYVKLQKIDRILRVRNRKANRMMFFLSASLVVAIVIGWYTLIVMLNFIVLKDICYSNIFVEVTTGMATYVEIILASLILLYLAVRLHYVNVALEKVVKKLRQTNMSLAANAYYREKDDNDELVAAIHCILDSWRDCIRLFQFPILSFTCQIIVWDFTLIQNVVTGIKNKNSSMNNMMVNAVMLLLAVTSLLAVSFLATIMNSKKCKTKKICFNILSISSGKGDKIKKNAQDILMLLETTSTFSIYGIYTVDNRLPLHIFAVTATYTIVLLQFATL